MALNDNYNIANLPTMDIPRSRFDKSHKHLTTFNVGELVPIFVDEILPGTTINIRTNKLVRLQTLITPIFDSLMMDTYFFFIPNRLVFNNWKQLMGENTTSAWYPEEPHQVPHTIFKNGVPLGSVADHMGIPIGCEETSVNSLPLRMYALLWNEFFRDENLSDPVYIPVTEFDTNVTTGSGDYRNDGCLGLGLLPVAKYKDFFTTALPAPQKGPSVTIPNTISGLALVSSGVEHNFVGSPLKWNLKSPDTSMLYLGVNKNYNTISLGGATDGSSAPTMYPTNLYANLGKSAEDPTSFGADIPKVSIDINQLRLALATQRLLETDSRFGTRYTEVLQGHFSITSPDARLQRPEFIGGNHIHLYVDSVVQNSETTANSPLGDLGAYSVTADSNDDVSAYTALEHGFVIGVCAVRYEHTYQQGLDKMWSRRDRLDYFWPEFSNLGEIGIKQKELCMLPFDTESDPDGVSELDAREKIFGYQEYAYDYRMKRNYVTGEMHSGIQNTLDWWHLADYYNTHPVLGNDWIQEDGSVVDRVIAVSQRVSNQVMADFYFEYDYVAPMPVYSIPAFFDMR